MNKFLTSVSSIGAVVLLVTAGCVAERSPEEISYNATVSRLDQGGDYLFYLHLDGIAEEVDDAVDTVAEAVEPESESTVEMIHYGLDLLGIDQLRGFGLSSRRIAAEEPFYRIRCFEYTGENPEGVLFDLAGRENRPFTMHRWIPKGTRLAAGGFLNLGAAYRALAAGLKAAPFEEMKEVPEILDEGAKATFGQSAETLLDSVSGEYFLLAATVGENDAEQNCALMLVIPDQGGVLGSRLLKEYAPMLTRVEGRENTFALPVVFPLPGLVPQVTFGSDRITLVSNPAILAAVEKAAAGNGAAADPELAAYFADMPEAGLNYLYVNIDKELIDSVLALGECAGNNPGLQPSLEMLGAILGALLCSAGLTPFMLGFFTTRIGNRAILSGMYAALVFSVYNILNYFKLLPEPLQWNIHIYMAGPVCNGVMLAVALAYSLFRPEPVTEQLRGLTVWTLDSPGKAD